jgi:hypothetical protein
MYQSLGTKYSKHSYLSKDSLNFSVGSEKEIEANIIASYHVGNDIYQDEGSGNQYS